MRWPGALDVADLAAAVEGYRPNLEQWFITYGSASTQAYVSIEANGDIVWAGGRNADGAYNNSSYVGLGNITFRADQ